MNLQELKDLLVTFIFGLVGGVCGSLPVCWWEYRRKCKKLNKQLEDFIKQRSEL